MRGSNLMAEIRRRHDDVICPVQSCGKSKKYPPLCPGNHGAVEGDDNKGEITTTAAPKKNNDNNDHHSHHSETQKATSKQDNQNDKYRFVMRKPALKIEEILELLSFQIGADGTLTFQPLLGLSIQQHDAIKSLLNDLKNGNTKSIEAFKNYLKNKKGISLDGLDITLSVKGETLTLTIPDPAQRKKFIEQFLRPEPQQEQEPPHQSPSPFRKAFSTRLTR